MGTILTRRRKHVGMAFRQKTDKYAGWPWLEAATAPVDNPKITKKGQLPRSLR